MASVKYYLNEIDKSPVKGVAHKNLLSKKNIITYMAVNGECTLAELAEELHISIPTMTKLVLELNEDGIVMDYGKMETSGGRRPNLYGLAQSSIYFAGVDVRHRALNFVVTDLKNNVIRMEKEVPFELRNDEDCLNDLCRNISRFMEGLDIDNDKIMGIGVSMPGRINSNSGYTYHYFNFTKEPLSEIIEKSTGFTVLIENETRASCFAEYMHEAADNMKNVIYFFLSYGTAVGIIIDGKLYYGKSGFAGEFGHIPFFDNDMICACGKKGCLETEVSGRAIEGVMKDRIGQGCSTLLTRREGPREYYLEDIIEAAKSDDTLSIELIEEIGDKAGRAISTLINLFNPEMFIMGGAIANAGDYFMLPVKSAVNKYTLGLVSRDTEFVVSKLGDEAPLLGVVMLVRKKILGL